jgi:hypothetical protein
MPAFPLLWPVFGIVGLYYLATSGWFDSDYDRGYRAGRAGDPMSLFAPDNCWVDNPETYNRNLEDSYCQGFFAGMEDRMTAGGD